jgi:hypothetical protein
MKPYRHRAAVIAAALASVAPTASATPARADVVPFAGYFSTTCSMPTQGTSPTSGAYSCRHTTWSTGCGAVAMKTGPNGPGFCQVDLLRTRTRGTATNVAGRSVWTCDNGAGTGVVAYRASAGDPAIHIPVNLVVLAGTVVVSGSYDDGSGRTVTVRAQFPATCSWLTQAPGYIGDITPV